jgi:hypothetical protein
MIVAVHGNAIPSFRFATGMARVLPFRNDSAGSFTCRNGNCGISFRNEYCGSSPFRNGNGRDLVSQRVLRKLPVSQRRWPRHSRFTSPTAASSVSPRLQLRQAQKLRNQSSHTTARVQQRCASPLAFLCAISGLVALRIPDRPAKFFATLWSSTKSPHQDQPSKRHPTQ